MKINLKKNKGQIMVLDVLLATVLLVFLFLILSKMTEVKIYERISDSRAEELEMVGSLVYDRLVTNQEINCYVLLGESSYLLRSCFAASSKIKKEYLGIPDGYECNISFSVNNFINETLGGINECIGTPPSNDVFEVKQNAFFIFGDDGNSRETNMAEYSILPVGDITLKVWRT